MEIYKYWPVLETMPKGWKVDKTTGSPLHGYEFVTNGKSVVNGQERALLRVDKKCARVVTPMAETPLKRDGENHKNKITQVIDKSCVREANTLARKKFQELILKDILFDLMVCEIEGWDKRQYIEELKTLIGGLNEI